MAATAPPTPSPIQSRAFAAINRIRCRLPMFLFDNGTGRVGFHVAVANRQSSCPLGVALIMQSSLLGPEEAIDAGFHFRRRTMIPPDPAARLDPVPRESASWYG